MVISFRKFAAYVSVFMTVCMLLPACGSAETQEAGGTGSQSIQNDGDGPSTQPSATPMDFPKPSATPEPSAPVYSIPDLSDLVEFLDAKVTALVGSVPWRSLIDARDSPDVKHDPLDDVQDFNEWVYRTDRRVIYVEKS